MFGGRRVAASSPQGRFAEGAARLDGRVPVEADAHGKHLLVRFDHDVTLHVHLGIYGRYVFGGGSGADAGGGGAAAAGGARRVRGSAGAEPVRAAGAG